MIPDDTDRDNDSEHSRKIRDTFNATIYIHREREREIACNACAVTQTRHLAKLKIKLRDLYVVYYTLYVLYSVFSTLKISQITEERKENEKKNRHNVSKHTNGIVKSEKETKQ